ncbi:MAG TPA: cell division protein ZapA [Bryobacteraceae bacterium]|nr:cell division protein ZapA [Bryobacteraceae bacterium]
METGAGTRTVRVTIFHQQYSVTATEDAGEVEILAQEVDELMTSIAQRAGNVDSSRVAVLACLHLADRLHGMERELSGLKARVGAKSREFSLLLDRAIE